MFSFILFFNKESYSKEAPGYILTKDADTIFGDIKIYSYNANTNSFSLNGINLESFYSIVFFKESETKRFKKYEPEDIYGFGFFYQSSEYIFHKFQLEFNSLFKSDEYRFRFLNLIYKGEVSLYRNMVRYPNPDKYKNIYKSNAFSENAYYDYYLSSRSSELIKAEFTPDIKTMHQLLSALKIKEEFIKQVNPKAELKDLLEIIEEYDDWLMKSKFEYFTN